MNKKPGRNDPCPCGSGKKYKQCCLAKDTQKKPKITAKWLNAPKVPNLMERAFGETIAHTEKTFHQISHLNAEQSSSKDKISKEGGPEA